MAANDASQVALLKALVKHVPLMGQGRFSSELASVRSFGSGSAQLY